MPTGKKRRNHRQSEDLLKSKTAFGFLNGMGFAKPLFGVKFWNRDTRPRWRLYS